jgi:hypothetical protein
MTTALAVSYNENDHGPGCPLHFAWLSVWLQWFEVSGYATAASMAQIWSLVG